MLILTPPLAPDEPAVHIVLDENGGRLGRVYREMAEVETDEKTIVENIINDEYSCPVRVVAFNTAEGWARDVTEDIALAVSSRARSENRSLSKVAQEFVERARWARTLGFGRIIASPATI
jgi:hypothetical protein